MENRGETVKRRKPCCPSPSFNAKSSPCDNRIHVNGSLSEHPGLSVHSHSEVFSDVLKPAQFVSVFIEKLNEMTNELAVLKKVCHELSSSLEI